MGPVQLDRGHSTLPVLEERRGQERSSLLRWPAIPAVTTGLQVRGGVGESEPGLRVTLPVSGIFETESIWQKILCETPTTCPALEKYPTFFLIP